jgi:hypothetical protein
MVNLSVSHLSCSLTTLELRYLIIEHYLSNGGIGISALARAMSICPLALLDKIASDPAMTVLCGGMTPAEFDEVIRWGI